MAFMSNYGYPQYGYQTQYNMGQSPDYRSQTPVYQSQQSNYSQTLFGKIVDSYDVAKTQDVPLGMTGIYPNANGSSIYVKQWCADGTTKTNEYRLVEEQEEKTIDWIEKFDNIYDAIDVLSRKIDKFKPSSTTTPVKKRKMEVVEDDA